jgi:integrase
MSLADPSQYPANEAQIPRVRHASSGGHVDDVVLRALVTNLPVKPLQFPSLEHLDERVARAIHDARVVDGLAISTTRGYRWTYQRFRACLVATRSADRFIRGQLDEQVQILRLWIGWLRTCGANHTSVNSYWRGLHAILARVSREDRTVDPTAFVDAPRPGRPLPRFLTRQALEEVFMFVRNFQWPGGDFERDRDMALVALMALGGCRLGEVLRLEMSHVDLVERAIRVIASKGRNGGKSRTVYMPAALHAALSKYIQRRRARHAATGTVFLAVHGDRPLGATAVKRLCATITRHTGIKVAPHMFRHTCATLLRQDGVSDRLAMEQLGHTSLVALQRYSHVSNGELHREIQRVRVNVGDW